MSQLHIRQAWTLTWFRIIIQMEDFKNPWPALEKFREKFTLFNDDIQGTGAVIAGGLASAIKQSGTAVRDQRLLFFGAGSAGVGVARQIVQLFMQDGLTEDEARQRFWLLDSRGLITKDRGDKLATHKVYFARDDNAGKQYQTLEEVVDLVKPTILMGLSTIGNVFTPQILKKMATWNTHPIIFPLSNPSANSECTFEDAIKHTNGKALFASGSPFPDFEHGGKQHVPGQGNKFPYFAWRPVKVLI
jgi:malate dehydrogenase (oxaloacetate-decarboxylating)(NADP+)